LLSDSSLVVHKKLQVFVVLGVLWQYYPYCFEQCLSDVANLPLVLLLIPRRIIAVQTKKERIEGDEFCDGLLESLLVAENWN